MKTYKSNQGMEFNEILACVLDNETDKERFVSLYAFMHSNYSKALLEWRSKRNFQGQTYGQIEAVLLDIDILKR